jgi:hypothetical protein
VRRIIGCSTTREIPMTSAHGSCLCGDVRFTVDWPSKWVAHCHCTLCQRAHGAAFVTWFGMANERARIDDVAGSLRWFESSPGAERGFCARCGGSLFFRSERWPGEIHIARANLEGDADRAPMAHVFWDTHVDWTTPDPNDGLRRMTASECD